MTPAVRHPHLALVHQLHRHCLARRSGVVLRAAVAGVRGLAAASRAHRGTAAGLGRRQRTAGSAPPATRRGAGAGHHRCRRHGSDRGGAGAAHAAHDSAGPAEEVARQPPLSVRAAVVRDHRPARRRQDDGAAECRPAFPAGGADGPGRDRRHRRHAAVRLVVHRGRRADRHRRPLHHAGLRTPRSIAPAGTPSSTC